MKFCHKILISLCFFLSGALSLMLEVVWSKSLSYVVGNTMQAATTVIASFMAGLALGSFLASRFAPRWKRPILAYGLMEAGIAIFALISLPLFRGTRPLFSWIYNSFDPGQAAFFSFRFCIVFILLMIPATLMGMSLPVVVGALTRNSSTFFKETGFLYALNTLGAVTGTAAAGFIFIPMLGLRTTLYAGALLGFIIFSVCFWLQKLIGTQDLHVDAPNQHPDDSGIFYVTRSNTKFFLFLFGLSGAAALVYEIAWFRSLSLVTGPSVFAFSAMLTVYLAGIALGSALMAPWVGKIRNPLMVFALLEGVLAIITLFSLRLIPDLNRIFLLWFKSEPDWSRTLFLEHFATAALLVLPPCLIMGAMFPIVAKSFQTVFRAAEENIGKIYIVNTVGGITGSLIAGFWLLPTFGLRTTLVLASSISMLIALSIVFRHPAMPGTMKIATAALVLLLAGGVYAIQPDWDRFAMTRGDYRRITELLGKHGLDLFESRLKERESTPDTLLFFEEGLNTTITVTVSSNQGIISLAAGGKIEASNGSPDMYTQSLCGHLPFFLRPNSRKVCIIGHGSGVTVGAALSHPNSEITVLEFEEAIVEASHFFDFLTENSLENPRCKLIVEDGRTHLAYTQDKYDIIISEPSNPWMAGINNLFTENFFHIVEERLNPGGIFLQWIPLYEISEETAAVLINTLQSVFPETALFIHNSDLILISSQSPLKGDWSQWVKQFEIPAVNEQFRSIDIHRPEQLLNFYWANGSYFKDIFSEAPKNTDDSAWVEYHSPMDLRVLNLKSAIGMLYQPMPRNRLSNLMKMLPGVSVDLAALEMGRFDTSDYFNDFVFGTQPPLPTQLEMKSRIATAVVEELASLEGPESAQALSDEFNTQLAVTREYIRLIPFIRSASRLRAQGRIQEAEKLFRGILKVLPDQPQVLMEMGALFLDKGELEEAMVYSQKALEYSMFTTRYLSLCLSGRIANTMGDNQSAYAFYDQAMAFNPYHPHAFVLKSQMLEQSGRAAEAQELLQKGIALNPRHAMYAQYLSPPS